MLEDRPTAELAALKAEVSALRRIVSDLRAELDDTIARSTATIRELSLARRRAEAATRAKSEFLANMSHELRTPLTAILGFTQILIDECSGTPSSVRHLEHMHTIYRNGRHLLRILSDILDLSKIEAGRLSLELTAISPAEIVADVETLMRSAAQDKGIGFDVTFLGRIPAVIRNDSTRLRQTLLNLLGNAIKFTQRGGVRVVVDPLEDPDGCSLLRFRVSDTGIGLSPEACERIFDPFTQADASTTRIFGGTGLGLSISRKLARAMGGDLTVNSIEGQGSTFTLTVDAGLHSVAETGPGDDEEQTDCRTTSYPLPDEDDSTRGLLDRVRCLVRERRVLLVEDGEDNRRLIRYTLERAGFEVSVAENGEVGVDLALAACESGQPFDAVLMDMQMPVLDGYEATCELRRKGYTGAIIALTAHAMREQRDRCLEVGCNAFVSKPISRRELITAILEHLPKAID